MGELLLRTVHIPPHLLPELVQHLERSTTSRSPVVFPHSKDQPIRRASFRSVWLLARCLARLPEPTDRDAAIASALSRLALGQVATAEPAGQDRPPLRARGRARARAAGTHRAHGGHPMLRTLRRKGP